ncbi:MAG: ACP S-malonyltransferase, partial [Gammaproteobacteria bacterium]
MSGAQESLAIVFPGQGSQAVGMLAELNAAFPVVTETFAQASDALGLDLWSLAQNGPEETLNETQNTQPAMLAAGVATWRVWEKHNGTSAIVMAGHSLGEYTALVCSGSLDFATGIQLVAERGKQMQSAVPTGTGAMAAIIGLSDETVADVCRQSAEGGILERANFNAPG